MCYFVYIHINCRVVCSTILQCACLTRYKGSESNVYRNMLSPSAPFAIYEVCVWVGMGLRNTSYPINADKVVLSMLFLRKYDNRTGLNE